MKREEEKEQNALSVDVLPASNHETVIGIIGPGSVKPLGSHAVNMHKRLFGCLLVEIDK